MVHSLNYTIINSQVVKCAVPVVVDGNEATAEFQRAVIEARPDDQAGKTLTIVLPPDALADFPEGTSLTATFTVVPVLDAPAAES